MNTIERNELLTALYQVTSKADLLKQFDSKLAGAKGTKANRYSHLLEQIIFYSHAIIFGHRVRTALDYRDAFMTTAKKSKLLKLSDEDITNAFSFLNRTDKRSIVKSSIAEPRSRNLKTSDICTAKDEIKRLKSQLDNKTYELSKGQKEEDKQAFIRIALVALSTGARLKDIMEDLTVSTKRGLTYFNNREGVILELDTKTIQGYLKAIRSHYKDRIEQGTDYSTGIRKAVKRLNISNCKNTNNLNQLYKQCLTSSPQK